MRQLHAAHILDTRTEGHLAFVSQVNMVASLHNHDFHEFFLVLDGQAEHVMSQGSQPLRPGHLGYIRPADVHCYQSNETATFSFINLAFSDKLARQCMAYLECAADQLFAERLPPLVFLPDETFRMLQYRLQYWNTIPLQQVTAKRQELRALLVALFACLLQHLPVPHGQQPQWLNDLLLVMRHKQNMQGGLDAMRALSQKSSAYLCRAMQRWHGQTPTAYILEIRLSYAANLLVNSNLSVLEIMLDAGFENASYFNRHFKARFAVTPRQFRQAIRSGPPL
jgi:AraC family cel operon transcriptional repressor